LSSEEDPKPVRSRVPLQIKRNTLLLVVTQALVSTGSQLLPALGGLIMLRFTDALAFVGLTFSIRKIANALMSYPAGKLADARGRKPVLFLGLLLMGVGSIMVYYSIATDSFLIFIGGLIVAGLAMGTLGQITVAAIDMYPSAQRGEGVSYVLAGRSLGSIGSPFLVWATTSFAASQGLDNLGIPWLIPPVLMVICGALIYFIRPDPLEIAKNKWRFYTEIEVKRRVISDVRKISISFLLRKYPVIMIMALSSVILKQYNYGLTMISVAIALHAVGMFGFSTVFGRLADRRGRKLTFRIGSVVLAISGLVAPLTRDYWAITGGLFLVGLGWSAVNVGSTAMLGDSVPPTSMGQIMGIHQLVGGALGLFIPTLGGIIAEDYGFPAVGVASLVFSIPILLVAFRLSESTPGTYE
jgi:MFS family permease